MLGVLYGWHIPQAYDAALRSAFIHDIEHLTFFIPAMIYWWHVVQAAPYIRKEMSYGTRVAYLLFTLPFSMLVGLYNRLCQNTTVPALYNGASTLGVERDAGIKCWAAS